MKERIVLEIMNNKEKILLYGDREVYDSLMNSSIIYLLYLLVRNKYVYKI